jgi:hypothetical protein
MGVDDVASDDCQALPDMRCRCILKLTSSESVTMTASGLMSASAYEYMGRSRFITASIASFQGRTTCSLFSSGDLWPHQGGGCGECVRLR